MLPSTEHPPAVGGLVLLEQHVAGAEGDLGARGEELAELVVTGSDEEAHPAEVVDVHHIVARYRWTR